MKLLKNYSVLIPVLVLVIMAVSMGILTSRLGYFMDDWPNVFFQTVKGPSATEMLHGFDGRPLQGWFRVVLYDTLGMNSLVWQLFSLGLRYFTVLFSWLTFRRVWPKAELQLGLAAILFAVYPIFAQQPLAITFIGHWIALLCFFLSTYLMLLAGEHRKWFIPLTLLGVILSGFGLTITEYFIGLEFVRPFLLWYVFSRNTLDKRKIWNKVVFNVLPYYLVSVAFVIWRIFLVKLPTQDRNELTIIGNFLEAPFRTIINLVLMAIQDLISLLLGSWYKTYQPEVLKLDGPVDILALGVTVLVAGTLLFTFWRIRRDNATESTETHAWKEMIITGLVILLAGAIPGWLIGRQVSDTTGLWNDRFGMASMAGAALVVVVLLEKILLKPKIGLALIAVMVGLASGWQIRNINDYRWSWTYQQRLYSQLMWRIPSLEPDTLFLSENEFFPKMGVYPTAFAINTLYPQSRQTDQVDYWYLTIPKYFGSDMKAFLEGEPVYAGHWQAKFTGNTHDSIVVDYRGEIPHCLWVLGPEDYQNPVISETTKSALNVSDLSRIHPELATISSEIGKQAVQPANTWCYFFEKADLAQQLGDWEEIRNIWDQSLPYQSGAFEGVELGPFIDGFLRLGDYAQAGELTLRAQTNSNRYDSFLCSIWKKALGDQSLSDEDIELGRMIETEISCDLF